MENLKKINKKDAAAILAEEIVRAYETQGAPIAITLYPSGMIYSTKFKMDFMVADLIYLMQS